MLKIKKLLKVFVFFVFLNNLQARDWFSSKKDVDAPLPAELNEKDRSDLVCDHIIEDFSTSEVGSFPKDWQPKYEKHLKPIKDAKLWVVERDSTLNQNVLKGTYATETMTIVKKISDWNLDLYPYFEWNGRALSFATWTQAHRSASTETLPSLLVLTAAGKRSRSRKRTSWRPAGYRRHPRRSRVSSAISRSRNMTRKRACWSIGASAAWDSRANRRKSTRTIPCSLSSCRYSLNCARRTIVYRKRASCASATTSVRKSAAIPRCRSLPEFNQTTRRNPGGSVFFIS